MEETMDCTKVNIYLGASSLRTCLGDKIETLALHTSAVDYPAFKIIDALCNYRVALFTINDTTEIPAILKKRIDYIYTDSLGLQ